MSTYASSPASPRLAPEDFYARSIARAPQGAYPIRFVGEQGVTLIDTLVGVALMLVVFVGIAGVFQLSVDVITNNKARAGAIALAGERMEYLRSLPYASIGTSGGVPAGNVAQSETTTLNGVTYTRRTIITYADDPKDGTGGADQNSITADYKAAKVDVAWTPRFGPMRHVDLSGRFSPASGLETNPCPSACGTLVINVANAESEPLSGASVSVTNTGTSPAVNFNTFTNQNGSVTLLAAPAASGYGIVVTNAGYSTDRTYTGTGSTKPPLSVSSGQTTTGTFQIDVLSSMDVVVRSYAGHSYITSVPFSMHGAKTTNSTPTYKYAAVLGGSGAATTSIPNLEWDTYTLFVGSQTGYDLAFSCEPGPIALPPNTATTTTLYVAPHTTNSLSVKVASNATGALINDASVRLYKAGYDATQTTSLCGQTFFSGLAAGTYSVSVTASGYTTYNASGISVASSTQYTALMQ